MLRDLSSPQQSMAYWIPLHIETASPSEFFAHTRSLLHSGHFLVRVENEDTELTPVNVRVLKGSVLGSLLYLLYTADLPNSPDSNTATFARGTAVLTTDGDPAITSQKLQTNLHTIQKWSQKWRIKDIGSKPIQIHHMRGNPSNSVQLP
jgi:hypothetical protein